MSSKICSFCNSQDETDRWYWQSEDGSACMCSECSLKYGKSTIDILNEKNEESDEQESSSELAELCDSVSSELMDLGYLKPILEDGDLTNVSINVEDGKRGFKININLTVKGKKSGKLSPDEANSICNTFDTYLEMTGTKDSFKAIGYDLDDNFEGYYAHMVE